MHRSSSLIPIWIHGASLGDVNALRSISIALHQRGHTLSLSASTGSGRARWQQIIGEGSFDGEASVTHRKAPLLSPLSARRALEETEVKLLILELLEVWPPWISAWVRGTSWSMGVSQSGRCGRFPFPSFSKLSLFLAQTELDAQRAISMGCSPDSVSVCGDAKVDNSRASLKESPLEEIKQSAALI